MANSVDPDQTAPIGAVCSGSMPFASVLNSSEMLGNYLQQTTSRWRSQMHFFLGTLRVKMIYHKYPNLLRQYITVLVVCYRHNWRFMD